MAVLKQPYTGVRGMRYQFMLDNLPEQVAELKASGETESYLEQIEMAYRNRISELTPGCMKSCGATTELRSNDLPSFIKKANSAEAMATVFNENIAMAISKSTSTLVAME